MLFVNLLTWGHGSKNPWIFSHVQSKEARLTHLKSIICISDDSAFSIRNVICCLGNVNLYNANTMPHYLLLAILKAPMNYKLKCITRHFFEATQKLSGLNCLESNSKCCSFTVKTAIQNEAKSKK